jgi:hypothetical protein
MHALTEDILFWKHKGYHVIVCGDLNARIGNCNSNFDRVPEYGEIFKNAQGDTLVELMNQRDLYTLNNRTHTHFTCIRSRGQSIVDYVLSSKRILDAMYSLDVHVVDQDLSDHTLLVASLPTTTMHKLKSKRHRASRPKWNRRKLQTRDVVSEYQKDLSYSMRSFVDTLPSEEVASREALDAFALDLCFRMKNVATTHFGAKFSPGRTRAVWWTSEYDFMRVECCRLFEVAMRTKCVDDWSAFTSMRAEKNKLKRNLKRAYVQQRAARVSTFWKENPGSKEAWNVVKQFRRDLVGNSVVSDVELPFVVCDGEPTNEENKVLEAFTQHYKSLGNAPAHASVDDSTTRLVNNTIAAWKSSEPRFNVNLDSEISKEELDRALRSLPNWKACDHDDMIAELFKCGGGDFKSALLKFLNCVWKSETIPDTWCLGTIVSLHKSGDKGDPGNYRGITLLSIFRKLFSIILSSRLNDCVSLHESQAAFRSQRSCTDHIYTFARIVQAACRRKVPLYAFFLDIRKAYDTVWRDGLMYKLLRKGVDGRMGRVLLQMMSNTRSRVRIASSLSSYFDITLGVGQGDPLSTFLFDVFIDDLLEELHDRPVCSKIGFGDNLQTSVADLTYADDVNAMSLQPSGLQGHIDVIDVWLRKWRAAPNTEKSKVMCFLTVRIRPFFPSVAYRWAK